MDEEKKAPSDWYVLHTLTGQEMKVQKSIEARRRTEEMGDYIGEAVVTTERVTEIRKGKKITVVKKFFPGYVFVQLNLYDKRHDFLEPTWRFIRETAGVLGFIGGDKPEPLAKTEVDAILHRVEETDSKTIKPKVQYEPGETVKIIDGPFMSFSGTVDEVDPEHGKMKVSVAIFGRSAPVELEYWQVERFTEETPMPEEESPTPEV